jgi:hypothetical protein
VHADFSDIFKYANIGAMGIFTNTAWNLPELTRLGAGLYGFSDII